MHTFGVEKGWSTSSSENNQKRHFEKREINLTCLGSSVRSLNFLGFLLLANLQPLKYILHEQPNENDAPQVSGSSP